MPRGAAAKDTLTTLARRLAMQFQVSRISRHECSAEEWQARVDLAAAHRLAVMHGLNEGIFNHLTQVVPGNPDRYYQIPFGMHWSEVKASSRSEEHTSELQSLRHLVC